MEGDPLRRIFGNLNVRPAEQRVIPEEVGFCDDSILVKLGRVETVQQTGAKGVMEVDSSRIKTSNVIHTQSV